MLALGLCLVVGLVLVPNRVEETKDGDDEG